MTWKEIFDDSNKLRNNMLRFIEESIDGGTIKFGEDDIRCLWFNHNGDATEFYVRWLLHDPTNVLHDEHKLNSEHKIYAMLYFVASDEKFLYPIEELLDDHLMLVCQHIGHGEYE